MRQKISHRLHLTDKELKATAVFISRLADENIFPLSVILFGSKARGDYDAESDVDLLLVLPDVSLSLRDHVRDIAADVSLDYSTYLSTRVWSEAYFEEQMRIKTSLFQEVKKDGVELLPVAS
jgi:predicted nucleotidyltransferase